MLDVKPAPESDKEALWQLFQEYAEELSTYDGEKRKKGCYHYPCFDLYWKDPKKIPLIVLYDHQPIGFCLLQDIDLCYRVDEFFIRPIYRRRGFGKLAVEKAKEICELLGRHEVLAANVYVNNEPALEFWKSVGFTDTGRRTRVKKLRLVEMECDIYNQLKKQKT
ncbi:MAG: GNAT family N-acetyltransferase [Armatimonadota bacterium]